MEATTPDGVTLHYTDTGSGDPPIVFLHGWCCDHSYWRDQAPAFTEKHRVIALDQRGHGASDKPDQDYTVAGFADDVAWLINELGLDRPVIVGHSMGGTIAVNFARSHPDLTRGLVLIDSPLVPLPEERAPLVGQLLQGLSTPAYAAIASGFVRMNMFNVDSPPSMVEEVTAGMGSAPQRVMATALASTLAPDATAAGPIPVPAIFIRAATQYASEEQLRERYPGLEVTTLPGAHFIQMEKPEETNALIAEFVAKVTVGAPA